MAFQSRAPHGAALFIQIAASASGADREYPVPGTDLFDYSVPVAGLDSAQIVN